eukprot:3038419-Rhodomonas_salina.1
MPSDWNCASSSLSLCKSVTDSTPPLRSTTFRLFAAVMVVRVALRGEARRHAGCPVNRAGKSASEGARKQHGVDIAQGVCWTDFVTAVSLCFV